MLAGQGGMERLRAAEKVAKERRLCLYANAPAAVATGKSEAAASNGQTQTFDATVVRIWSGDQISVVEKDSNVERRLQLSSTRGPKQVEPLLGVVVILISSPDSPTLVRHFMPRKPANS